MTKERSRILMAKSQHEHGAILFSIQEGQHCRSVVRLFCQTTKPITRRDALVGVSHSDAPTVRVHGPSSDQRCLRIRLKPQNPSSRARNSLTVCFFFDSSATVLLASCSCTVSLAKGFRGQTKVLIGSTTSRLARLLPTAFTAACIRFFLLAALTLLSMGGSSSGCGDIKCCLTVKSSGCPLISLHSSRSACMASTMSK